MKILVLTTRGSSGHSVYIMLDKIVSFAPDGDGSVVKTVGGDWCYVKETAEFIAEQICSANVTDYSIYNSKEGV